MKRSDIAGKSIGESLPVFIIAEAGVNHNGCPATALELVDAAVEAGCDAVKFQTFVADNVAVAQAPKADYQKKTTGDGGSQLDMLRKLQLSPDDHGRIAGHCRKRNIVFMSSPFDESCVDLLMTLGVPALKLASGELTNIPLLEHTARQGIPVILSTGMATLAEVGTAVGAVRGQGNDKIILLHCVTSYPADPAETNLRAMATMRHAFDVPVGFSDHTLGCDVVLAAVALGAVMVEKHFTLDRKLAGPDHAASLEPAELKRMVQSVRRVESALGDGIKRPSPSELPNIKVARRSLVAARDVAAGVVLTREHLTAKRPYSGISPAEIGRVIGRTTGVPLVRDQILEWRMLQ